MVVIQHMKSNPNGGDDLVMYFKKFNRLKVDWVDKPEDAKKYKDDFSAASDLRILKQASRGSFYVINA